MIGDKVIVHCRSCGAAEWLVHAEGSLKHDTLCHMCSTKKDPGLLEQPVPIGTDVTIQQPNRPEMELASATEQPMSAEPSSAQQPMSFADTLTDASTTADVQPISSSEGQSSANEKAELGAAMPSSHPTIEVPADPAARENADQKTPVARPERACCANCGIEKPYNQIRRANQLCQACHLYFQTHGKPRPEYLYKKPKVGETELRCENCGTDKTINAYWSFKFGRCLCHTCHQYQRVRGVPRPPHLFLPSAETKSEGRGDAGDAKEGGKGKTADGAKPGSEGRNGGGAGGKTKLAGFTRIKLNDRQQLGGGNLFSSIAPASSEGRAAAEARPAQEEHESSLGGEEQAEMQAESDEPAMQAFQLAADEVLSDSSADEAEAERPVNDPPKAPKNVWEQAAMAESGDSEGWESSDESGDERLDCGDLGNDEGNAGDDAGDESEGEGRAVAAVGVPGRGACVLSAIEMAKARLAGESRTPAKRADPGFSDRVEEADNHSSSGAHMSRMCDNCLEAKPANERWSHKTGMTLCRACDVYQARHDGQPRPPELYQKRKAAESGERSGSPQRAPADKSDGSKPADPRRSRRSTGKPSLVGEHVWSGANVFGISKDSPAPRLRSISVSSADHVVNTRSRLEKQPVKSGSSSLANPTPPKRAKTQGASLSPVSEPKPHGKGKGKGRDEAGTACDTCGTTESGGWFHKSGTTLCFNCNKQLKRRPSSALSDHSDDVGAEKPGAKRSAKRRSSLPYDVQTNKRRRTSSDSWTRASLDEDGAYDPSEVPCCSNCGTHKTTDYWSMKTGVRLCRNCYLYQKDHAGQARPEHLFNKVRVYWNKADPQWHACDNCGSNKTDHWRYKHGERLCNRCYQYQRVHNGVARPVQSKGLGGI